MNGLIDEVFDIDDDKIRRDDKIGCGLTKVINFII